MNGKLSTVYTPVVSSFFILCLIVSAAVGQVDPDPNSPTPILMSYPGSRRAVADPVSTKSSRVRRIAAAECAYDLNSRVYLDVTNITLMKGEDASAFRDYAQDAQRRVYRFPVIAVESIDKEGLVYALTGELRGQLGG